MRRLPLLVLPLLLIGCRGTVDIHPPPGSRPHPATPRAMSRSEAISAGRAWCNDRRYDCRLEEAHLTGRDRWKVKFDASRGDARGKVHLEFHAFSRALIDADEKVKVRGHAPDHRHGKHGHGRDDDHHGRGKGKAKGHAKHDH